MFHGGGGGGMFHGGGGGGGRGGGGAAGVGGRMLSALDIDEDDEFGKVYDSKVIGRMPKYLAPVKKWLGLGALGMMIRTGGQLAIPYLIGTATDKFIRQGDFTGLNIVAIVMVAVMLLQWLGEYMSTLFLAYAGQSVLYRMRTEMFDHLHRLSLSFFDHNKVGKLMSRVQNDVSQLQEVITAGILNMLTSILTLVGIAVVMMLMDAKLALITLSIVPVLGLLIFIWQRYARRAFIRVRQAIAVVNDQLQESISGVRVVQSLSREQVNATQFDNVNKAHLDANIEAVRLQAFMMPTVQIMTAIAYALLIVYGGYQVLSGATQVGVMLSFILYVQRFFDPVLQLTMQYTELQRAMASGSRIFELLDVEPTIKDNPGAIELPPVKGELKFNNVSFSYDPEAEVLHDINLTVNPGETVAFIGRTGAGKSSLMNLASRFYEVDKGEVMLDGYNVASVTQESLRKQIGIVPQEAFLFSGTIEDNIRYGRLDATHDDIIEAAQAAGVHDFISHLEHGYETQVGERGHNLSAGQRQLVCLARAILADPAIIILDEATSNVDTNTERIMQRAFRSLSKGRTSLIIAHRLSTITSADRIVALENGRIVETGSHRELMDKKGLYYQMYETLSASDT